MLGYRSAVQIVLIIISVVIIVTYIKPAFSDMKATQDETAQYQKVLDTAQSYNSELQRLLSQANSFSTSEIRALERYLPDTVDPILVMRDIDIIVRNNGMNLDSVTSEDSVTSIGGSEAVGSNEEDFFDDIDSSGSGQVSAQRGPDLFSQQFTLGVSGTYEQFKTLLQDFERNAYPLEVADLSFSAAEENDFKFGLTLETYAFSDPKAESNIIEQF